MTAPREGNKRLRIAVLNRSFVATGGGAERYSIALVEQLAQKHEVHVFAQQIEHAFPGVRYHRLWTPFRKPRWINQLWFAATSWWATRNGFDVVHSHENTWHGQVHTVHVLPVKYTLFEGRIGLRRAFRWIQVVTSLRLMAYLWLEMMRYRPIPNRRIVATSPSLKNVLERAYPLTISRVEVLTPGIGVVAGPASPQERRDARLQLGLPVEGNCIVFVANDYKKKGLSALLGAMSHLPSDTYVAVVGNASHIPTFSKFAKSIGMNSRVHFLGPLANVTVAYVAADCLAHPTLEDTFAMVVLEAMSHGLPVVVSGVEYCGISGLLESGTNAMILNDPNDSAEIGQLLQVALATGDLRRKLVQEGPLFAQYHCWSEISSHLEAIYFDVCRLQNH